MQRRQDGYIIGPSTFWRRRATQKVHNSKMESARSPSQAAQRIYVGIIVPRAATCSGHRQHLVSVSARSCHTQVILSQMTDARQGQMASIYPCLYLRQLVTLHLYDTHPSSFSPAHAPLKSVMPFSQYPLSLPKPHQHQGMHPGNTDA